MNNYEMIIDKKELLGILSEYYSRMYNKKITVIVQVDKEYYGYYDEERMVARLYYEETIEILRHRAIRKVLITDIDIKAIINELIDENYEVDYLIRNIENITTGYYKGEHTDATFTGIKLSIKEKQKKLVLK